MPTVDSPQTFEKEAGVETRSHSFLERWKTDVAPVHDRTERSREFRARYALLTLKSLFAANGLALIATPLVAGWVDAPVADHMRLFLFAEGAFLLGLVLALATMLVAYATLDVDVTRQKGERAAARRRLIESEYPEQFGDAPEAEGVRSDAAQARHWKLGVRLSWVAMALTASSILAVLVGGVFAGSLLATAAG